MKLPILTRKEHDRVVTGIHERHYKEKVSTKKFYETQAYNIRSGFRRLLDKLASVRLSCLDDDRTTWRLVFDLNPRPIIFSLERGDDHFMIEQIAEELKYKVIKELRSLNIQCPKDLGLER